MELRWGHLFDMIIINNDTQRAYQQLLNEINSLEREPQWVPAHWLKHTQRAPPAAAPALERGEANAGDTQCTVDITDNVDRDVVVSKKTIVERDSGLFKLILLLEMIRQMVLHLLFYFLSSCDRKSKYTNFKRNRLLLNGARSTVGNRDDRDEVISGKHMDSDHETVDENIEFRNVFPNLSYLVDDDGDPVKLMYEDIEHKKRSVA